MINKNTDVLECFWFPPNYYKECSSGVNQNTIKPYSATARSLDNNRHFQTSILPQLRMQITPYKGKNKYLRKSKLHNMGFCDVVNDALREIYKNRKGYVFSQAQLIEILKFIPDASASHDDGIYFVWKE